MINSYKVVSKSGTRLYWNDCGTGNPHNGGGDLVPSAGELEVMFQAAGCSEPGQGNGFGDTETYFYSILIPTKNDGLLGPQYCRWNENDDYNDQNHNFYYGDEGTEPGYNH